MPRDATWELHPDCVTLSCGPLCAVIDVCKPAQGLHRVSLDGRELRELAACEFLGVAIDAERPDAIADCYQRGEDLIVRYAQTADRPFAVEADWRAGMIQVAGGRHPYVDLVLSVETSLLDSRPELEAKSSLALQVGEMPWNPSTNETLARFLPLGLSYVEMIHPDDALASRAENTTGGVRLTTRLFGRPLEKGVILRSRLRGMFVPLKDDRMIASRAFRQFAAAPPPLTA